MKTVPRYPTSTQLNLIPLFVPSPRGHPSTPRHRFKQHVVDTKARVGRAHLNDYDLRGYPKDSQLSSSKSLFVGILYHQIVYMVRI
jgi:hypothetical protein